MSENYLKPVKSLEIFTDKLIDYAGLFPPASLGITEAYANFRNYSMGLYNRMLDKFIIPVKKLPELFPVIQKDDFSALSVILTGGNNEQDFRKSLETDLTLIREFRNSVAEKFQGCNVKVLSAESKLPKDVTSNESGDDLLDLMIDLSASIETEFNEGIPVFLEASQDGSHEATIVRCAESIASLNKGYGFKLRTGGTEAKMFPSAEMVAFSIMTCIEFGIPMKCTAGLHHPIRHYSDEVKTNMHGFFNVFGAGIMAYALNMDEEEIISVLEEEEVHQFRFTDSSMNWRDYEVSCQMIAEARESLMVSFGSCSFDEPVDDLKTLEYF